MTKTSSQRKRPLPPDPRHELDIAFAQTRPARAGDRGEAGRRGVWEQGSITVYLVL